jgi:DNA-binding NarL/FixJ family response regulator
MPLDLEREVVVLSSDRTVRDEVHAVVTQRPGARAVFADAADQLVSFAGRAGRIVVIDDEERSDAVALVQQLKAGGAGAIVYLAANHSAALEEAVRRAGASFYAVKSSRDGDLTRVIEVMIARSEG